MASCSATSCLSSCNNKMNNQMRREGIKTKLWSSVITGGLPKCKRRAPKSQSLSKPFYPTLHPDFWDVFFSASLPTGGSDEAIWQSCTAISDEDSVQRGFSFLWGPWEHQELWRWDHTSPSTRPDPLWLPDLPATALRQSISKAVRGAGCQQGKGKGEGISKKQNWQQPPV